MSMIFISLSLLFIRLNSGKDRPKSSSYNSFVWAFLCSVMFPLLQLSRLNIRLFCNSIDKLNMKTWQMLVDVWSSTDEQSGIWENLLTVFFVGPKYGGMKYLITSSHHATEKKTCKHLYSLKIHIIKK